MAIEKLSPEQENDLLNILRKRFEENRHRHKEIEWDNVSGRIKSNPDKIAVLHAMEETGGEPDVIETGENDGFTFFDCAAESPKGRRSLCYDQEALLARKQNKPANSATAIAEEMGIQLLNEEQYRLLQGINPVDTKTSSWLDTPEKIRKLGGAIFGDYRFGRVFIYHNGADSYYAARGFRGWVKV